jgi:hypothetical protein
MSSGWVQWPPVPSGTVISMQLSAAVQWQIVTKAGVLVGVSVAVGGSGVSVAVGGSGVLVTVGVNVGVSVSVLFSVSVGV